MDSQAELAAAIADLGGTRFASVGRTLNMVEVGLTRGNDEIRLHVQCPVRIVRRAKILLGSTDFRYPLKGHSDQALAFDQYQTQFDRSARLLTEMLGDGLLVREAHLRRDGAFHLATTEELRIEVFPAVSGPIECWRLFIKGSDKHYVYPPAAVGN
jgi:hypothetical protein